MSDPNEPMEKTAGMALFEAMRRAAEENTGVVIAEDPEVVRKRNIEIAQMHMRSRMQVAEVPKRHMECRCDNHGPWREKLDLLREMRKKSGVTVALCGSRGNGKTQMGVELIRDTVRLGNAALYTTAVGFFIDLKSSFGSRPKSTEQEILERYAKPIILVVDECDKRSESDWANQLFFELVNIRYGAMLDTVFISNQTKKEFEANVGDSIVSRMVETGGVIECNWESFRK